MIINISQKLNGQYLIVYQMSKHIVTQIKKDVEQSKLRQYSLAKQKKQLKYYILCTKSIIKIQRYFRKYLLKKAKTLQIQIINQLSHKQYLQNQEKVLDEELEMIKKKREKIQNNNIMKLISSQKQNVKEQINQIVKNVVETSDQYAKNIAISKISLEELKKIKKQQKQLKAQIKQLQLEKQCYEQRITVWQQKLKEIRQKIIQESSIKKQLVEENLESIIP